MVNPLPVTINGVSCAFSNRIGGDALLLESFNELASDTFGLSFAHVGGDYEPHVLAADGRALANVSVNRMPFYIRGRRRFFIQLGTVMTRREFFGKGLCRWLLEFVLAEWRNRCDAVYLFANRSVLDFYPRFGFVKMKQYEYTAPAVRPGAAPLQRLSMDEPQNAALVLEKYRQGNPFSAFFMAENEILPRFYCEGILRENVYYSPGLGVAVIGGEDGEALQCRDVWGKTQAGLRDVLGELSFGGGREIRLGFTPLDTKELVCRENDDEDDTLFVLAGGEPMLQGNMMFPILSHA